MSRDLLVQVAYYKSTAFDCVREEDGKMSDPVVEKTSKKYNINRKSNKFSWRFFRKQMTLLMFPKYFVVVSK